MATTTKQYLDLNGLKYLLSKLNYTKAAEAGKFLTGITEKNGVISATSASLTADDIPAIGTPETYSASTALTESVATITNTITRNGGKADLTASFKLGVSGDLGLTRTDDGALTIGYTESVKGVKADGYLTLGVDDKLLDINSAKLADASTADSALGTLLTTKAYVDKQVSAAIAGGVQYKGTTATIPDNPANGDMWKLTEAIKSITGSKAGDVIIYHTSGTAGWDLIPSGDDVEYTGIKVGDTTVIDERYGGNATFAAGEGLAVTGAAGTVTYSHAISSGAAATTSGFYKIATDKFGHVTGAVKVAKADITGLLGDYVSTIGGKSGAITLKAASKTTGAVNLSISDAGELQAAIVGLGTAAFEAKEAFALAAHTHKIDDVNGLKDALDSKQNTIAESSATIASVKAGVVTLKAGIKQTNGVVANNDAKDITLAKVATTGKAEDVTYDKGTTELEATNVQGAITELAGKVKDVETKAGVTSFGGKTGAITVNTTGAADGSINFTVGDGNKLTGTVAGWDTKQNAFKDGTAKIVDAISANVGYEAYKAADTAETATIYASVAQDNGAIKDGSADGLTISNITKAEIDTLFA